MGDVVVGKFITRLECPPERVLESAIGKCKPAIVIGYDEDGELYFASSEPDGAAVLWLMELAKKRLIEIGDGE